MDKEIYIRKLIDKDNFAYVMLNIKKTNYLGEYASLILVTEYGDYFIPCSLSLIQMRNNNRWETCNHENKNLTLKIVGSTT